MAEFPALNLWTDAYLADTRFLTTLEHGAYLLLLMEAWRRPNCDLPDDDRILAKMAGLQPDEWAAIRDNVMAFWKRDGRSKTWTQKRLLIERDRARVRSRSQRDKAVKRWKREENPDAAALPGECPADASTATTTAIEDREPNGSPSSDAHAHEADPKPADDPTPAKPKRSKAPRSAGVDHPLPDDWKPNLGPEAERIVAQWPGGMLKREEFAFRNHAVSKGRLAKNWDAAFRTWIAKAEERRTSNAQPYHGNQPDRRDGFERALDRDIDHFAAERAAADAYLGAGSGDREVLPFPNPGTRALR